MLIPLAIIINMETNIYAGVQLLLEEIHKICFKNMFHINKPLSSFMN